MLTEHTSRYKLSFAIATLNLLEVTVLLPEGLNESNTPSVQNRREGRALRKGLVDLFSE
mgnify:CR=1